MLPGGGGIVPRVLAGVATGALGAFLTSPLDLAKVRMVAQCSDAETGPPKGKGGRRYANSLDALMTIAREEGFGFGGLWRGCWAAVLRAGLASGAQLTAYDAAKAVALSAAGAAACRAHPAVVAAFASQAAALAYTTAAAPADLIKSRLMAQRAHSVVGGEPSAHARSSVLEAAVGVVRDEGVLALWRGWVPATLTLMPVVAIVFPLMEFFRSLLGVGSF
jgi:hypothetical protein